jgi:predicted permease
MESLLADLRYAIRTMARRPGFTLVAALSLGLGIGANTTIFSLVDVLLLRSLPVADPGSLVKLYTLDARNPGVQVPMLSHLNWKDYRREARSFSGILGYDAVQISVAVGRGDATLLPAQLVSDNYFELLGVRAARGRIFTAEEETKPGAHPVAVASDHFWHQQLGGDPAAVGRSITINGHAYTVVGVAPADFYGGDLGVQPALWVPMTMNKQITPDPANNWYETRRGLFVTAIGRLRPGVTVAAARAEMRALASHLEEEFPKDNKGRTIDLLPLAEATLPPGQRAGLVKASLVLLGVVALVLLIACANVANLLLARGMARRHEIAVRLAQGARRGRLVRQLLTESLMLALLGGAVGLLLMIWAHRAITAFLPTLPNPVALELGIDLRVLAFALAVTVATGLLFGLAPALQSTRPQLVAALRTQTAASLPARHGMRLRGALVVAEVALSLVALIAAGLFLRSLAAAHRIDPGYDAQRLLSFSFDVGLYGLDKEHGQQLYRAVREQAAALPGVESVALVEAGPLQPSLILSIFVEGRENPDSGLLVQVDAVDPSFFRTAGVPILAGRGFTDADRKGALAVAVVNRTLAEKFWPNQPAVGRRFTFHGSRPIEVVGVARDAKYLSVSEDPQPYVYLPLAQQYAASVTLLARAARDPAAVLPSVERQVRALAPGMPLVGAGTLSDQLDASLWAPRLGASLLVLFGALALALSAIGIYGVMSFSVAQRARDIGIRMALGAQPGNVLGMVVAQGMRQVALGMAVGVALALASSRVAASLLIDTSPTDPVAFVATPLLLALVALLSIYAPARRATRVNPTKSLRSD